MKIAVGYITHPSEDAARELVEALISKHLIACANLFPIQSVYRWKGAIERSAEVVTVIKTQPELWEELCREVAARHPYEVPCILRFEAEANEPFAQWVREETGPQP